MNWQKIHKFIMNLAGKEKSFREERLEAIQKKEEEKWKRRSLPSAQNEDGRPGFKSMQVVFLLFVVLMVGILVIRQVVVVSLGWCELADEDLTPENSSKAVNRFFSFRSSLQHSFD